MRRVGESPIGGQPDAPPLPASAFAEDYADQPRPSRGADALTPIEEIVSAVWEECFGHAAAGPADELGIDATVAATLAKGLHERLNVQLSAEEVCAAPALAAQAVLIDKKLLELVGGDYHQRLLAELEADCPTASSQPMAMRLARLTPAQRARLERAVLFDLARIPTRPADARAASFLLAPAPACAPFLFCFYRPHIWVHVARYFGSWQPTCGIFVPGEASVYVPDQWVDLRDIDELATLYLAEVRRRQPHGPYYLAGHCIGGRVALEIAQRLLRSGEEVALLALVDTMLPRSPLQRRWRRFAEHTRSLFRHGPAYAVRVLKARRDWRHAMAARGRATPAAGATGTFRPQVAERYAPGVYPGKIVLFRATERHQVPGRVTDPTLGWERVPRGGLDVHAVPGDHITVLNAEYSPQLADLLRAYLPRK